MIGITRGGRGTGGAGKWFTAVLTAFDTVDAVLSIVVFIVGKFGFI